MDVLYIGDHKLYTNHFFSGVESVQTFQRSVKDYEPLLDALEDHEDVSVTHLTGPETIDEFPETTEELSTFDALIVSDLSKDTLLPHFLPDAIPGPNRVKVIKEFVENGGGLLFCGGWMTFQGYHGIGNWHNSHVADVLPLEIAPVFDDRVEAPEGGSVAAVDADHPLAEAIDWDDVPEMYGYNRSGPVKNGATLLATVEDDVLAAAHEYENGRVFAYTSDPGPKWGLGLMGWTNYQNFWIAVLEWATQNN